MPYVLPKHLEQYIYYTIRGEYIVIGIYILELDPWWEYVQISKMILLYSGTLKWKREWANEFSLAGGFVKILFLLLFLVRSTFGPSIEGRKDTNRWTLTLNRNVPPNLQLNILKVLLKQKKNNTRGVYIL